MPMVSAETVVDVDPRVAFAVSQTTGQVRLRWDRFVRRQHFLDGATAPGKGVRTLTVHRWGARMVSEYVSYAPPRNVGMRMVTGPWFFRMMAGAGGSSRQVRAAPAPPGSTTSPAGRRGWRRWQSGSAPGCSAGRSAAASTGSRP